MLMVHISVYEELIVHNSGRVVMMEHNAECGCDDVVQCSVWF